MSQDDILSTKGCKRNPYSETEYSNYSGEWQGGWIRNSLNGSIQFRDSNGYLQQTITKGQSANPFTEYEYNYKLNQEMNWPGGWVVNTDLSIRYINAYNEQVESFSLGKQRNPYYYVEFNNLYVTNDWHGGWVEYDNGGKAYINAQGEEDEDPAASGSGCGSGCGCGSGSGSGGLRAGSARFRPSGLSTNCEIAVAWEGGNFSAGNSPSVSAALVVLTYSSTEAFPLSASWITNHTVGISGSIRVSSSNSGNNVGTININTTFGIPGEYYNN